MLRQLLPWPLLRAAPIADLSCGHEVSASSPFCVKQLTYFQTDFGQTAPTSMWDSYGTGMKAMTSADRSICLFCGTGSVVERNEEIAFRQWSDKGYIRSRVAIPIAVCDQCDARYSLDPEIDKILDDAFQREYDKRCSAPPRCRNTQGHIKDSADVRSQGAKV
jgi:hypothetical protein